MTYDNNFLIYAKHFYGLGLNITCNSNIVTQYNFYDNNILKSPYHKWEHLKHKRQDLSELLSYDWNQSTGIGTITGYNQFRTLDIDGCTNYDFIQDLLIILGLPSDYEWVVQTGSLSGFHIHFYADELEGLEPDQATFTYPPNDENIALFEKMELLCNTNVVLPPSFHNSGSTYSFVNCRYPKSAPLEIDIKRFNILLELFFNRTALVKKKCYYESIFLKQPSDLDKVEIKDIEETLYFIFDFETDGLIVKNNYPNAIQISWIVMDIDGIVHKKNTELIDCDFDEDSKALKINKLTIETIRKLGKKPQDVYKDLANDLKYCDCIVAHNLDFDYGILKNEFNKYGILFPQKKFKEICTMTMSYNLTKNANHLARFLNLSELYEFLLGYKIHQIHNAQYDVMVLSKCLRELILREKREMYE
jgi:DNA polymerase III epsilon subunit-like protein